MRVRNIVLTHLNSAILYQTLSFQLHLCRKYLILRILSHLIEFFSDISFTLPQINILFLWLFLWIPAHIKLGTWYHQLNENNNTQVHQCLFYNLLNVGIGKHAIDTSLAFNGKSFKRTKCRINFDLYSKTSLHELLLIINHKLKKL